MPEPVVVTPKSVFVSKTFWVNALTLVLTTSATWMGYVPAEAQPYIVAGLAIGNIVLRFLTGQPIG